MNIFEKEKSFLEKASKYLEPYELDIALRIYSDGSYCFEISRLENDDEIVGTITDDKTTIYSSAKKNNFILTIAEPMLS